MWKSDGTTEGTVLVKDINPSGDSSFNDPVLYRNKIYFAANDGTNGVELWESDGTEEGTLLVSDINSNEGEGSAPANLTVFDSKIFFTADNGSAGDDRINGRELWRTNGSEEGTTFVRDINPDGSSFANEFTIFDESLYFAAENSSEGRELYVNDPEASPFNTAIYRFQNSSKPGTYIFVGEEERASINANFPSFQEEGLAFQVGETFGDDLVPYYRFQSVANPGTYLFVDDTERTGIFENYADSFSEDGLAFYVNSAGTGLGETFYRFHNTDQPGTYIFAAGEERANILANFTNFVEEGAAFEVG